jgi:hypothetical protein
MAGLDPAGARDPIAADDRLALARLVLEGAACADAERTRVLIGAAGGAGATLGLRSRARARSLAETLTDVVLVRERVLSLLDGSAAETGRAEAVVDAVLVGLATAFRDARGDHSIATAPTVSPSPP